MITSNFCFDCKFTMRETRPNNKAKNAAPVQRLQV